MYLSKYADIFGKPNQGIHQYRMFGLAAVDVLATIGVAFLLSRLTKYGFWAILALLVVLGIFLHWLFGVKTTLNTKLFDDTEK